MAPQTVQQTALQQGLLTLVQTLAQKAAADPGSREQAQAVARVAQELQARPHSADEMRDKVMGVKNANPATAGMSEAQIRSLGQAMLPKFSAAASPAPAPAPAPSPTPAASSADYNAKILQMLQALAQKK